MLGIVGTTLLIMSISNSPRKNMTSSPGTFETKSVHSWINSSRGTRCLKFAVNLENELGPGLLNYNTRE